ncbi:M42 family peptidase [bacterium]|nr:MAG: M42 family peptidase [bacterium]
MDKKVFNFFKKFADSPSPSGYEQPAQRQWREYVRPFVDRIDSDVMGNTWGVLEGKEKPRVMLAGHADEVGLMVKYIDDDGFLFFSAIGGVDLHLMPGKRVNVHGAKGQTKGIIGRKPIHLLEAEERTKVARQKDLAIDIGASNRAEAEKHVAVGDAVTFADELELLLGNNVMGRGFDDKVGSLIVAETLRRVAKKKDSLACSVYGVSTVQEELGLRGATTSSFGIDPDVGICVEVTFATDHPGSDKKSTGDIRLGKGPVITRGANINHRLFDLIRETAKKNKIPVQIDASARATGTDANVMQLNRAGVATALISIPLRYMHTSAEVLSLVDVENAAELVTATLLAIDPTISWKPE